MTAITNIESLRQEVAKGNPVVIAGYGRESTHKGYLSWILDSRRNRGHANSIVQKLIDGLVPVDLAFDTVKVKQEVTIHGARIDLVLDLYHEGVIKMQIPIELKVCSGSSGDHQSKALRDSPGDSKTSLLVLLGASSEFSPEGWKDLNILDSMKIAECLRHLDGNVPDFCKQWLESLEMEIARKDLALSVYREAISLDLNEENSNLYLRHELGYLSDKHLWYYIYGSLKRSFLDVSTWQINDGGHNPVLTETDYKQTERRVPDASLVSYLYFEYVYSDLVAKLDIDVQSTFELETFSEWTREFVRQVQSKCSSLDLPVKSASGKVGKSMSLLKLPFKEFWDFDQVAHFRRQFTSVVTDVLNGRK